MKTPEANLLSLVTSKGAPSAEYDLFLSYQLGERTAEEFYTENARLTGEKTGQYTPKLYIPLTQSLRSYCDGRVYGNLPYDQQAARQLGVWVHQVHKAKELNDHDFSHLLWAIERCARAKLDKHVYAIEAKIGEYMSLEFPFDQFELAMKTKVKDADERESRRVK